MSTAIYASLIILSVGLFTSISLLALSHILILVPCLYFLPKNDFKKWPKSAWALLAITIAVVISVVVNHDIMAKGYAPIGKIKYFVLAILSITPFTFYFKNHFSEKKIKIALALFLEFSALAAIFGIIHVLFQYDFLALNYSPYPRSAGFFSTVMTYAHTVAFMLVLLTGMIIYRNEIKNYVNLKFLYGVWLLNLGGLYMTYTRGVYVALIIAIPFFFFKKNKKIFLLSFAGLVVVGALMYVSSPSLNRSRSDGERWGCWQGAVAGFQERPWFGLGFLNYEPLSVGIKEKYNLNKSYFSGHAHNNYLEMLVDTGIFGALAFVIWILLWFSEMYQRDDLIARLTLPFIVAFIVSGITQSTFIDGTNMFFIMAVYSLSQVKTLPRVRH